MIALNRCPSGWVQWSSCQRHSPRSAGTCSPFPRPAQLSDRWIPAKAVLLTWLIIDGWQVGGLFYCLLANGSFEILRRFFKEGSEIHQMQADTSFLKHLGDEFSPRTNDNIILDI